MNRSTPCKWKQYTAPQMPDSSTIFNNQDRPIKRVTLGCLHVSPSFVKLGRNYMRPSACASRTCSKTWNTCQSCHDQLLHTDTTYLQQLSPSTLRSNTSPFKTSVI